MPSPIHPSANKHGIAASDILHAIDHASVTGDVGNDDEAKILSIGPDRAGNLLEVIERSGLVIHAMPLRKKYDPLLRRLGEDP